MDWFPRRHKQYGDDGVICFCGGGVRGVQQLCVGYNNCAWGTTIVRGVQQFTIL